MCEIEHFNLELQVKEVTSDNDFEYKPFINVMSEMGIEDFHITIQAMEKNEDGAVVWIDLNDMQARILANVLNNIIDKHLNLIKQS